METTAGSFFTVAGAASWTVVVIVELTAGTLFIIVETTTRSFFTVAGAASWTVVVIVELTAGTLFIIMETTAWLFLIIVETTAWSFFFVVMESATRSLIAVVESTAGLLLVVETATLTSRLVAKLSLFFLSFFVTVTVGNSEGLVLQEFFFVLCRFSGARTLARVSLFCHAIAIMCD